MPRLPVQSFRLKNFKAVRDSGTVRLNPFTVFIGNNGAGKSSLIEGLETYQTAVTEGLDEALRPWLGLEHVLYKGNAHTSRYKEGRFSTLNPLEFNLRGWLGKKSIRSKIRVGYRGNSQDDVWIQYEYFKEHKIRGYALPPDGEGYNYYDPYIREGNELERSLPDRATPIEDDESILVQFRNVVQDIERWQFVLLDPGAMGYPHSTRRTRGRVKLARDGGNVAEYLLDIRSRGKDGLAAFKSIIETLAFVLPYAEDVQPTITREIERAAYLQLSETGVKDKLPGWLFSTGTLRILALLALFRDPDPPPLIVVEEIENGLDPRTIHLIIGEIRNLVEDGRTQVIATSHSPYLLDLLNLEDLILTERRDGQVTFSLPAHREAMDTWTKRFAPGRLYTMGRLSYKL